MVEQACACARRSGGIYDPTVLPLMTLYGFYGPERTSLPARAEVDRVLAAIAFADVRVDRGAGTIALARRGMGLDLGSIGKGWAVDRAVEALRAEGVCSGLVDAGGNVYGLGVPGDGAEGWSVALFHPVTGRAERDFTLRDAAVATSANNERFRVIAGHRIGHLFDAKRGTPADGHVSVSVLARSGVESDQMSTAAFLLGPDRFRGWPGALDALSSSPACSSSDARCAPWAAARRIPARARRPPRAAPSRTCRRRRRSCCRSSSTWATRRCRW